MDITMQNLNFYIISLNPSPCFEQIFGSTTKSQKKISIGHDKDCVGQNILLCSGVDTQGAKLLIEMVHIHTHASHKLLLYVQAKLCSTLYLYILSLSFDASIYLL
eukprot:sb/3477950/